MTEFESKEAHKKQKKTYQKCNINFITQYALINDIPTHIENYTKTNGDKITCQRGHELVLCNGTKIKKYFRHKNSEDMGGSPMTEWHSRMQSYFPITERYFEKIENQIRDRRADVFIEKQNYIIEIQHSHIDKENVICRDSDYKKHNLNIIWLINGNTNDVILEELSTNNYLITFKDDWKYASFSHTYNFILLDVDNKIFKVPVKKVCNKMILVKEWKPIEYIMKKLNISPNSIENEWEDDNEIKASMTVYQKGAGNGKTFGIWKSICSNLDKQTYIILTKQHSAKSVILKELNEQAERNEYHIHDNLRELNQTESNRKYIVKYKHKNSQRNCIVIIGTIDSFIYNLTKIQYTNSNYFEGLVNTIIDFGCSKVNEHTGIMKYANENIYLNKHTELWIDEAQDLPENYFKAVIKLMLTTKIDVVAVGDKLQSLEYRNNFMTCIEEDVPNITIKRDIPINMNRRINVNHMSEKINNLIEFKRYGLPKISIPEDNSSNLLTKCDNVIEIIEAPRIYSNDDTDENKKRINKFVNDILDIVDKEVDKNKYVPEDFLFIFPIMKSNSIASELETKLNHYWIEKYDIESDYKNYAVLHKHEEGQVINMDSSIKASRIVSIRTSKGDGRNIVFVLGCTETSLKIVGQCENIDLIYESYLHVALTRAKEKIYFALEHNNDNIHKRFGTNGLVEYKPNIKANLILPEIIELIDRNKVLQILEDNDIKEYSTKDENEIHNTQVVDWQYHCIRRSIYIQYAIFIIIAFNKDNSNFDKSQIKTVLDKISKLHVLAREPRLYYSYLNSGEEFDKFPVCQLSTKKCYFEYQKKLIQRIEDNQKMYKQDPLSLGKQTPLEAVIQHYVIDVFMRKKYHEITPVMIYNVIDSFENYDQTKDLIQESEKIKGITETVIKEILQSCDTIEWNIEHMIGLQGNTSDIDIYKKDIPIIGFSDSTVYHLMFKTDINSLNYWDVMIELLCERFLIFNPKDKGKDIKKFKNKIIQSYIFILKQNKHIKIEWDWDSKFTIELKEIFKEAIIKHFSKKNKQLFQYFTFVRNSKKWKGNSKTPFDYIANEFEDISYIRYFFKSLHERSNTNRDHILTIINSEELFSEELTKKIEDMCDSFFNLNVETDDEW